ncbi:hypothetical protein ACVWY6_003099 [Williamsia sp. R60]
MENVPADSRIIRHTAAAGVYSCQCTGWEMMSPRRRR